MTEIPIVVSDDVVTVGGYTDKVELQLSVGATGERGSRIFTGSVNPNTLPSNDPIWGGYTDFKRGDIYLLRDTDLLEVWEYLWSGGEYVWVQTVDNIAGGGGSVTLDPDLDAIAALTGTGILKRTAPNTWALDTTSYLTANQTITLSGDASGSGTTSIVVTVADDSHSHTGSTISGLDAGDTTTGTFNIARIPTGTSGTTVALGNHTHSYQPVDGDLTAIAAVSGTGYLRRTGVDTWTLDTPATATWGTITGTLSSQTDLNSALSAKAPTASPTFTGTVTATTIVPSSGYLSLNYGGGGFDAVRSGQLQVLRDGVGDWNTLFAAYGTAAEVAADTPRFLVYGLGAFEATYEGKIYGTGSAYLKIDGGAGSERQVQFQTVGSQRWTFGATSSAESGSNAGSNFSIARYSDAGAWIDNPIEITRSTGTTTIKSIWLASGGKIENLPTPSSSSEAANKGYVDTQLALKAPIASPTFTGVVSLSGVSTPVLKFENGVSLSAKNSSGTDEQFLWPRWTDNVMYLNYGAAGWSIRNSGSTVKIFIDNAGQTTFYNSIIAPAATTSIPSIRIPHGTAPSSPTNGDIWTTTTSFMARLNGTSVNLLGTQGSTYVTIDDEQVMRVMGV